MPGLWIAKKLKKRQIVLCKSDKSEQAGARRPDLPDYTYDEVAAHGSPETGIWVIYKDGVYDITEFIKQHPGGPDKISMAIGGSVEPFWDLYSVHLNDHVFKVLESLRIGNVDPSDEKQTFESSDYYGHEPKRHPALKVNVQKPFNAETPPQIISENFHTPNDLFFVRNHLPVPKSSELSKTLTISGVDVSKPFVIDIETLKKQFPLHEINSTVMCAGNKRAFMNESKPVKGILWKNGAVSNAKWTGIKLADVLIKLGVQERPGHHVIFQGCDSDIEGLPYEASIPLEVALDPNREVLLAFAMNGKEIPLDHGYPLRVVVPGVVGARQVKWLKHIIISENESQSFWQQKDYKTFNPSMNLETADTSKAIAIQEYPVTSAICVPSDGAAVILNEDKTFEIKGYALSGGGKKIVRVDVSVDGGKSWSEAELVVDTNAATNRNWAWALWKANVRPPITWVEGQEVEIICKATDNSFNTQPETDLGIWNARGLLENKWPKVKISAKTQ